MKEKGEDALGFRLKEGKEEKSQISQVFITCIVQKETKQGKRNVIKSIQKEIKER